MLGTRVKIISERFKQSVTIGYDHEFNSAVDIAEDYLVKNGYILTGKGEGKYHMYILSTTFEPLKSSKN